MAVWRALPWLSNEVDERLEALCEHLNAKQAAADPEPEPEPTTADKGDGETWLTERELIARGFSASSLEQGRTSGKLRYTHCGNCYAYKESDISAWLSSGAKSTRPAPIARPRPSHRPPPPTGRPARAAASGSAPTGRRFGVTPTGTSASADSTPADTPPSTSAMAQWQRLVESKMTHRPTGLNYTAAAALAAQENPELRAAALAESATKKR